MLVYQEKCLFHGKIYLKLNRYGLQSGDYVLVTLRIDRDHQMFARLASETIVEKMFTPVSNDDMQNQVLKTRPYRLLRIGTFY